MGWNGAIQHRELQKWEEGASVESGLRGGVWVERREESGVAGLDQEKKTDRDSRQDIGKRIDTRFEDDSGGLRTDKSCNQVPNPGQTKNDFKEVA